MRLVEVLLHPSFRAGGATLDDAVAAATVAVSPAAVGRLFPFTPAVYVAYDSWARCRYVGSVARTEAAVAGRLREHYRDPAGARKRRSWDRLVVVGLSEDLEDVVVRQAEGRVAFRLAPLDGSAHPAFPTGAALTA